MRQTGIAEIDRCRQKSLVYCAVPSSAEPLNVCLSGALGAVGRELVAPIVAADDLVLQSAVARRELGRDIGEALGGERVGVPITDDIEARARPAARTSSSTTPIRPSSGATSPSPSRAACPW